MGLTLVLGPANSAKAGQVLGAYRLAVQRDALLVVPTVLDAEHYERELCVEGPILGRALTFSALLDEIAVRVGYRATRISERQRERLLRHLLMEQPLAAFGQGTVSTLGLARSAARLIASLQLARATPGRLSRALTQWSAVSGAPEAYGDAIAALYRRYLAALAERELVDPERYAWQSLHQLRATPERWGRTAVFLYGFDDLTAVELDAIQTLSGPVGAAVTVSLTYEAGREALAARATVVEDLRAHADRVLELAALDTHYAPAARAPLHHLERTLFAPNAQPRDPGDVVTLIEAQGEPAEAHAVADEVVVSLAAGVAADQIVVVCRSLTRSGAGLEAALHERGVAAVSARQIPLGHTALGRGLLALLRMAVDARGVECRDLLAYLRTPGVVAQVAARDALAARLQRAGRQRIDANELGSELAGSVGTLALGAVRRLRAAADPLAGVRDAVLTLLSAGRGAAAPVLSGAAELDARAGGATIAALAASAGIDHSLADVLDLLGTVMVPVHGRGAAAPRSGAQDGLDAVPAGGPVLVAEPLSIRARRFRHVIVTGLNAGELPSPGATVSEPFFGEDGRRELASASGLVLAGTEDWLARERYLLYAATSRASERLTLSYRGAEADGQPVLGSPFLDDLERSLGSDWRQRRRRVGADAANPLPLPEPGDQAAGQERMLGPAALAHVRHRRLLSASALERYAACPVSWLVEQQLALRDLEPDPEPLARGSYMHALLERVLRELGEPLRERCLPRAVALLHEHLADADLDPAPGRDPEVKQALRQGIAADLRRVLVHEARTGNGWPVRALELHFGGPDELPAASFGDGELALRGVIDRVDVAPDGQRAIIRDYKSGQSQPGWPARRWMSDDKLQIALYLLATEQLLGLTVAGGLYQPLSGGDLRARGAIVAGDEGPGDLLDADQLEPADLRALLDGAQSRALELARDLAAGRLRPCPQRCSPAGGCRYPAICWGQGAVTG